MKKIILIIALVIFSFNIGLAHKLTVEIVGDEDTEGTYYVAMWDNEDEFLDNDKHKISKSAQTKGGKVTVEIDDVDSGWWAIAVLLDENGNKDMDYNMFGVPQENFGFSNNPTVVLSEPDFRECKFYMDGDKTISIEVD
ncbi:MAG: DUF2141 domain-containing protein [Chlorobiota bacterium]